MSETPTAKRILVQTLYIVCMVNPLYEYEPLRDGGTDA